MNTFTARLKKRMPGPGDFDWDDEWHDNQKIDDVVAGALLSTNRVISGGAVTNGGGLTANFAAVVVRRAGAASSIDAGSLAMSPAAGGTDIAGNVLTVANWVYVDSSGAVVTSLVPPSGDYIPLALVDTNDTGIVRIADLRPMAEEPVDKDVADGVPGLTGLSINFMNILGTIKSFFTNSNTAARTYTFKDRDGVIADDTDLARIGGRKNLIINGNFDIWQRAVSQTSSGYGSDDRWLNEHSGTTKVHSRQPFDLGQTLVPGNPKYFSRTVVTSVAGASNFCRKSQRIERVTTNAGGKATYSFYFDTDAPHNIAVEFVQNFGTGGSPSAEVTGIGAQLIAVTPGFKNYDVTVDLPSVDGKTLGTNDNDYLGMVFWYDAGSSFDARAAALGQQSGTFDLAMVQLEEGAVATDFERRSIDDELDSCMLFYQKSYSLDTFPGASTSIGKISSTTIAMSANTTFGCTVALLKPMRAIPAVTLYNGAGVLGSADVYSASSGNITGAATPFSLSEKGFGIYHNGTLTGLTAGQAVAVLGHYTVNAEL